MKSCVLVRNKSIIKMFFFFTSNHCLRLQFESFVHIIDFSSEIYWIGREIYTDQKQKRSITVLIKFISVDFMWEGDFFFLHWKSSYYWLWIMALMDLFMINTQLFISQDMNCLTGVIWITCGLLWCFYQLFELSFWLQSFPCSICFWIM